MAPMEFACFPPGTALFHLAYGITTSVLLIEVVFLGFRKVPFTCAHLPGKVNLTFLGVIYIFGFSAYSSTLEQARSAAYAQPAGARWPFLELRRPSRAHSRAMEGRCSARKPVLDYEDPAEPTVRMLGISTR